MQGDSILSTGKMQPKQEMNVEPEDKLTTRSLDTEYICHGSLHSFMENALHVTNSELQTVTVYKMNELNREPTYF